MRIARLSFALLLAGHAACGDHSMLDPGDDVPPGVDAGVDAPTPTAASVLVRTNGAPVADIDVVWSDPSGALIVHEKTGANGAASEIIVAGSALTLATSIDGIETTMTYLGVAPGDQLVWELTPVAPVRHGDLRVDLAGVQVGAATYRVDIGCTTFETQNPAVSVTGTVTKDCLGSDARIDLVATALSSTGAVVGYAVQTDVTAVSDGLTTVTMGAWQSAIDPLSFTLTNAPADTTSLALTGHLRADGIEFHGIDASGAPADGSATLTSGYFQGGMAERLQYQLLIPRGDQTGSQGWSSLIGGTAGTPATVSHDLAQLPPRITATTASHQQGRLQLAWTTSGSFATADGAMVSADWIDGVTSHRAYVMAPPSSLSPLTLPALPDALARFRPTGVSVFESPSVVLADADFVPGYEALRPIGWRLIGGKALDALPPSGGLVRAAIGGQLP